MKKIYVLFDWKLITFHVDLLVLLPYLVLQRMALDHLNPLFIISNCYYIYA